SAWARTHGITLVGGSIAERRDGREKLSNTSVVFDPEGELAAVYRKIHLFDVEVGGVVYRESEAEEPGDQPVVADAEDWKLGLTVCYDVRFPELYRILTLEGAELVTVPAHFTTPTGKDHWHVLLRARAIENQLYVAAAAQIGETLPGKPAYGRSLIADPWGIVVAQAPDEETVIAAELEGEALRVWDGDGAIRLLAYDEVRWAMLVERCDPGTLLAKVDPDLALDVLIGLLPRLWKSAREPFRPLAEEATWWIDYLPA